MPVTRCTSHACGAPVNVRRETTGDGAVFPARQSSAAYIASISVA
jgi:hypothetical protein